MYWLDLFVMPALVAGIHVLFSFRGGKDVDGRDKPGHDEGSKWLALAMTGEALAQSCSVRGLKVR
jgi:hypothetical protein